MFRRALFLFLILISTAALAATRPNIVLITLDSARADRMGFLGGRAKTPALDALAKESLVFERAYAQAPLTVVSHATLLTGTYPQTHQVTEFGTALAPVLPSLPDLLHAQGYRCAAFVGSIALDPRNGLAPGFDRGFSVYDAGFHPRQPGEASLVLRRADPVVARAIAWLNKPGQMPIFLWVHLVDPAAASTGSYDSAIAATDAAAGKLIAALRAHKLYDDALVVVAADHGQSLGAHAEDTHGIFLYDETVHVPLLMKLPKGPISSKHVPSRVGLIDVAPTILEVAAVPVPSQMQGQSLLRIAKSGSPPDQPVYARSDFPQRGFGWSSLESWRAGKYLYIRAPKAELYDLAADPEARKNLAQTSKATLETIAAQLEAFDHHFTPGGKTAELSSSEMQKLASLGYVGLQKSTTSTAATGTDPKDEIATANKVQQALTEIDAGSADKAASELEPIVKAQPNLYLAQFAIGVALALQQHFPQAVEHLHKAIELQPDSAWAHYYMGSSLLKTGDFKTAAVHLEIASTRLPQCSEAHKLLAEAYDHLNRAEDAKRERIRAVQIR
jgi:arylsulfatase A-like enzyme